MDHLLREFLADAEELIETLFRDIQQLREQRSTGRAQRELTGRIFRHVHTLKGTAATAGLSTISHIAHEFETLLDGVRLGRVNINEAVINAFDDAAHALSQSLDAAARDETLPPPLQLIQSLQLLAQSDDAQPALHQSSAATLEFLPAEIARALNADEARRLREATAEGQRLFSINVAFDLATFDERFRELSQALVNNGELLSTLPATAEAAPGAINFQLLYASEQSAEELAALTVPFGLVSVKELLLESEPRSENVEAQSHEESQSEHAAVETIAPLATHVRVELGKLDELISAAHELMTETLNALEPARSVDATTDEREPGAARVARIQQQFLSLEAQLTGLRRVPLAHTLERAARAGRQAARALGKDVVFEITGGDVLLDKSLVEAINDALLHLARNAVGHGIETPAERASAGKSERGTVRLKAMTKDNRVVLHVTDDGRGIDLNSVARTAVTHGFIEAGGSVSQQQAVRLIFRPGFTTAESVSLVSGRGIGLDIVERAVAQVGGEVRVQSEAGRGATFEMIVPAG